MIWLAYVDHSRSIDMIHRVKNTNITARSTMWQLYNNPQKDKTVSKVSLTNENMLQKPLYGKQDSKTMNIYITRSSQTKTCLYPLHSLAPQHMHTNSFFRAHHTHKHTPNAHAHHTCNTSLTKLCPDNISSQQHT